MTEVQANQLREALEAYLRDQTTEVWFYLMKLLAPSTIRAALADPEQS